MAETTTAPTRAAPGRARMSAGEFFSRYGVVLVFIGVIIFFSLDSKSRDAFPTLDNVKTMIALSAPLAVVALPLTIVLVMRDFDLSIGATIGLGGATAVVLMANHHVHWGWALA